MATLINEGITLYLGYGITSYPKEDASRLVEKFGAKVAKEIETEIQSLINELDRLQPDWNKHTLPSGSKWAVAELCRNHPELDDRTAAALEWVLQLVVEMNRSHRNFPLRKLSGRDSQRHGAFFLKSAMRMERSRFSEYA